MKALLTLIIVGVLGYVLYNKFVATPVDAHESVTLQSISVIEELNTALDGVTDRASAEAVQPQLQELNQRMADLMKRSESLGELAPDRQAELEQLPGFPEAMGTLKGHFSRLISDPGALEVVANSLSAFDQ